MLLCFGLKAHLPVEWLPRKPEKSVSIFEFFNRFVRLPTLQSCWGHTHHKNIFKPSNRVLLETAKQICGHSIVHEANLPHLVCRPCERRLNNTRDFQKVILETEQSFHKGQAQSKCCVDVSPSVCQPPRSRLATSVAQSARPSARTSLSFDSCQEPRQNIEVSTAYLQCNIK